MNIKLKSLALKNFKGIGSFSLPLNGNQHINISGDNATGKTSLVDSFHWLLFGKDSSGRSDFEVKTIGRDGKAVHNHQHEVRGDFEIDGRETRLHKILQEKWTKKRGRAEREFEGHTIDHFVDMVPVREGEYRMTVSELASEQLLRILTDPRHFNEKMKWQDRRRTLLEVCGGVTDEEVIASDKALAPLTAILSGRTIDNHMKVLKARKTETNRQLDQIPARIDEARQLVADAGPHSPETLSTELKRLRAELARLQNEKAGLLNGGSSVKLEGEKAEYLRKIAEVKTAWNDERSRKDDELRQRNRTADRERSDLEIAIGRRESFIREAEAQLLAAQADIEALRSAWVDKDSSEFPSGSRFCPTCRHVLPPDQVAEHRRRFNEEKALKLEAIAARGKSLGEKIAALETSLALELRGLESSKRLLAEVPEPEKPAPPIDPEELASIRELRAKIAEVEERIKAGSGTVDRSLLDACEQAIATTSGEIALAETYLAIHAGNARAKARIVELEQLERKLAAEYEQIENEIGLIERFLRAQVSLLEEKINSRFKLVRFRLFEQQINGGLAECCEATVNGVPYGDLNNAARINAGLDIINAVSEHSGVIAPVWIDNAESINDIIPTAGQQIRLYVSRDKNLTIKEN